MKERWYRLSFKGYALRFLFMLLIFTYFDSSIYAQQRMNLSLKNVTLKTAFAQIEKQSDYRFVYSISIVDVSVRVNLEAKNETIEGILKKLFNGTKVSFLIKGKQIILTASSTAPIQRGKTKITGTVTDENGQPFSSVTVFVKDFPRSATMTNEQGLYTIEVPAEANSVSFAFIGYLTASVNLGQVSVINYTMEPEAKELDEVVVIGFGEQRKAAMSSSVSTIKAKEIMQSPVANISNALAGRVPGLTTMQSSGKPGEDESTMYIRGAGTWNNAEPLYVIDGIERNQSQFLRIDPSEVESFSILKDAAATAVYGSKAANGVILVTTKRGKEGQLVINLNSSITINRPTRYPKYLNSYESLLLYNEALSNEGKDPLYSEEDLEHYRLQDDPYRYPNTDWYNLMMKDVAPQSNVSLNIRGGSKSVRYFLSGTYMNQGGQLKTSQGRIYNPKFSYERYTFRSNIDVMLTNNFTISLDLGGGLTDRSEPLQNYDIFAAMNRIPPWIMPALNPDGSYAGTTDFPDQNPMYLLNTRGNLRTKNNTLTSSLKLSYDFNSLVKGLTIAAKLAYDSNFGNEKEWTETQSTYRLISVAGRADRYERYLEPKFFGSSASSVSSTRKVYGEGNINWKRSYKFHDISILGIANFSEYRTGTSTTYNSVSFITRVNYGYKQKYFVELNAAYRGSENFAPGKRFGLFPSLSVGWNLHKEKFFKSVKFINSLKLRGSYGVTGNDYANVRFIYKDGKWTTATGTYARFGPDYGSSNGYTTEPVIANPNATWETAYQGNIGFDLSAWNNKISFSVDRFDEYREGILMTPNSTPGVLGIGVSDMNIGKTRKNGWEFEAGFNNQVNEKFSYYVKGNISFVNNKIISKDEPSDKLWWQKEEGKPIQQEWGYVVIGYFKDLQDIANSPVQRVADPPIPGDLKYLDYNGDGQINDYDRVPIGYPTIPKVSYGISAGFTFNKFSLNILFQGTAQSSVFISNYLMYEFYNRGKVQDIHQGRWTPQTAETATYPALHIGATSQNHTQNTFFLKDNPYVRLKNIEVAYNLQSPKFSKYGFKELRVFLSGVNLITWDRLSVVDPETPTGSKGAIYPQTKGYSLGLNFTF